MMRLYLAGLVAVFAGTTIPALAGEKPVQFWNLTEETISELYLAPVGTTHWSPNQCLNDKDGTVETDEMVTVKNIPPGQYDLKIKDVSGRTCVVKAVNIKAHAEFSVGEKELRNCTK